MALITLLGAGNIIIGAVSIVFYSIIVGIKVPMYNTGCGLWAGSLMILAGLFAVYAGRSKHRMAHSFALLFGLLALLGDIAALALSIYVFYYLTQVYPDHRENMPIFQVYMAFHVLWFLSILAAFFLILLQVKTAWSKMPEKREKGEVFVDGHGQHQPGHQQQQPSAYQPAPRPYYY